MAVSLHLRSKPFGPLLPVHWEVIFPLRAWLVHVPFGERFSIKWPCVHLFTCCLFPCGTSLGTLPFPSGPESFRAFQHALVSRRRMPAFFGPGLGKGFFFSGLCFFSLRKRSPVTATERLFRNDRARFLIAVYGMVPNLLRPRFLRFAGPPRGTCSPPPPPPAPPPHALLKTTRLHFFPTKCPFLSVFRR